MTPLLILLQFIFCNAITVLNAQSIPISLKNEDVNHINYENRVAEKYLLLSEFDSAYKWATLALKNSSQINYSIGIANAKINLAAFYRRKSLFKISLSYLISAKEIFEKKNDLIGLSKCETQIGIIYYLQKKYKDANSFFQESIKHADKLESTDIAKLYYLSGLCQTELGLYSQAERHLNNSFIIYESLGKQKKINECLVALADLAVRNNEYQKAEIFYNNALNWFSMQEHEDEGMSFCYLGFGNIKKAIGQSDSAIFYFNKAFTKADSISFYLVSEKAAKLLTNLYFLKGDDDQACHYQGRYFSIRDSILSADNIRAINSLESELALSKKQSELDLVTKQRQIDKMGLYSTFGGIFVLLLISGILYNRYRFERKTKNAINREKENSDKLLLNILPEETAMELKTSGKAVARRYEEATVLFADIKGFTTHAESLSPEALVSIIDKYFQGFDRITEDHGLEKIKTIGDAYMCVGGLPNPDKGKPEEAVRAALEMQDFVNEIRNSKAENEPAFEIRIGLHTGPVVAGVVGSKKFAYDIWGDTVNTAARMEQNSEPGKVNISQYTYERVKESFDCIYRGRIAAKNKGEIEMYFVKEEKFSSSLETDTHLMDVKAAEAYIMGRLKKELKPDLYYHSLHHMLDVVNAAMEIGRAEQISDDDMLLLQTAALYHDAGFMDRYKDHEEEGCELARTTLPGFGFTQEQIEKICGMILATRIPQEPKTHLEEILADADLDYLGRDDYQPIADSLYHEFLAYGIVKDEKEWNRLQVKFFESHHYFTKTSNERRKPKKMERLAYLKELVASYDA